MLLACSSCNSKYLVNSADLKPDGRTVRCAACAYEWFQTANIIEEETLETSTQPTFKEEKNSLIKEKSFTSNLPSTYIKEEDPKIINSIMIVLLLIVAVVMFWLIKREGIGLIVLLNFYIQEFYFNLKLIINDLAKLIHQIVK